MPYNPNTAESHLGIPYRTRTGDSVYPENTERGSLKNTYEQIAADLEAGLPLIKDAAYEVPKYHFNRKAANAFAARFYLYYQKIRMGKTLCLTRVCMSCLRAALFLSLVALWQSRKHPC